MVMPGIVVSWKPHCLLAHPDCTPIALRPEMIAIDFVELDDELANVVRMQIQTFYERYIFLCPKRTLRLLFFCTLPLGKLVLC